MPKYALKHQNMHLKTKICVKIKPKTYPKYQKKFEGGFILKFLKVHNVLISFQK
jgi:hypothetical protein